MNRIDRINPIDATIIVVGTLLAMLEANRSIAFAAMGLVGARWTVAELRERVRESRAKQDEPSLEQRPDLPERLDDGQP